MGFKLGFCDYILLSDVSVTYYNNGEDAIAFLTKKKHEIDIVLWDYHMPKINGLEALKTIGKDMDLPVVSKYVQLNQYFTLFSSVYNLTR